MFDPRYPWLAVGFLTVLATGALVYYGALVSGMLKDPLMTRLRMYGSERHYYPFCRFLDILGAWSLMIASMLDALRDRSNNVYAPAIFLTISAIAFGGSLISRQVRAVRELLPEWYFNLQRHASREERRRIAFAWLRIPKKMRWRLNGDRNSFDVWADMVRLSVIYGARDPDDPWAAWQ